MGSDPFRRPGCLGGGSMEEMGSQRDQALKAMIRTQDSLSEGQLLQS